jgi:hypothetical protein
MFCYYSNSQFKGIRKYPLRNVNGESLRLDQDDTLHYLSFELYIYICFWVRGPYTSNMPFAMLLNIYRM